MNEPVTLELPDMVGGTVAVVTLKPGDTLVLTCPKPMSIEQAMRLQSIVEEKLPGVMCMVMYDGLTIGGVIRAEPEVNIYIDPKP